METEQTQAPALELQQATPETATNIEPTPAGETPAVKEPGNNPEPEEEKEKYCYKLTDAEFGAILNENNGLFAQTAREIEKRYGIPYSRQAVRQRAKANYRFQREQKEEMLDWAKDNLFEAITQEQDVKLKYKASTFLLTRLRYGKE